REGNHHRRGSTLAAEIRQAEPTRGLGLSVARTPSTSPGTGVDELFQLLRDGIPRTRAELAKSTGLAPSTVAWRVDVLMGMVLTSPVAEAASTGGRPPPLFALNPAARVVIAADIGASHASVAVMDLSASVLAEKRERLDVALGPEPV